MCLICRSGWESENPLFFGRSPKVYWDDIVDWGEKNLKGRSMKAVVCKLAFGPLFIIFGTKRNSLIYCGTLLEQRRPLCVISSG